MEAENPSPHAGSALSGHRPAPLLLWTGVPPRCPDTAPPFPAAPDAGTAALSSVVLEEAMARNILTIKDLGSETCWMLVQQAIGIPDAKLQSDFMTERVALLVFARHSLPERLCVTAAVRQMGGTTIFEGCESDVWQKEASGFQEHLMPIFGYYLDCLYAYGLPVTSWNISEAEVRFPVINAGSPDAHPVHALADIACMLRTARYLKGVTAAWVGCANGTLHSLIEATAWFPFALRVAVPRQFDTGELEARAARIGSPVSFVYSPEEAVHDANFVFAGYRGTLDAEEQAHWGITPQLMAKARSDVRLLLSASPVRAIPVAPEVLSSRASQLVRQAEYRLRVHKRILHWVFEG